MKYQQPYGTPADSPYINGDPSIGRQGSIPPAAAFEEPQRELQSLIAYSGFTPSDDDLEQVTRAVRQGVNYVEAVMVDDNPNSLSCTTDPPLQERRPGLMMRVLIPADITGPAAINFDGTGFADIVRANGAALVEGDLRANQVAVLVCDHGSTKWQIANFQGFTSSSTEINTYTLSIPYTVDLSVTPNTITANFSPPITGALVAGGNGGELLVKLANDVTGPTFISVNGSAPIRVLRSDLTDLQTGDGNAGQILWMLFDGTAYQLGTNRVTSDIINTHVTFTVHGAGANFADLNTAMEYLRKYKITPAGLVTLLIAPGQFIYNGTGPTIIHPNGDRIEIVGATMSASLPATDAGYALTGNSSGSRSSNTSTNLTMLRTKFATELRFTNGASFDIRGNLGKIDGILATSDGSDVSAIRTYGPALVSNFGSPNGIAAVGAGRHGLEIGQGATVQVINAGTVVCLGNSMDGIHSNAGGVFFAGDPRNGTCGPPMAGTSAVLVLSNASNGMEALVGCVNAIWSGNFFCECNGSCGVFSDGAQTIMTPNSGRIWKNGLYGVAATDEGKVEADFLDFGSGGNANGIATAFANYAASVTVYGCTNVGPMSPTANTVGNYNSIVIHEA
jgi:hypothetical protein